MQLQYRGQAYNVQSASSRPVPVAGPLSRSLQYRGNAYTFHMVEPHDASASHAVNWRHQVH